MKFNRILYLSLFLLAFMFVYSFGGKVPYMLFYTILALPLVSILYIAAGYYSLTYEQELDRSSVIKGEIAAYTLRIANRSPFILPYINIKFYDSSGGQTQLSDIKNSSISPFRKREFCFKLKYPYRGGYELGVRTVEIQDFLGIFKLARRHKQPLLIKVYPRIIHIDRIGFSLSDQPDQISTFGGMVEDMSEIEEINPYHYGDSLRTVHWKLSAKVNALMVKKFRQTAAASAILMMDLKRHAFPAQAQAVIEDKHIETAVAVLSSCLHHGGMVRLVYDDGEIRNIECQSHIDFETAYRSLAEIQFSQEASFADILESQINNRFNIQDILLFTSNVNLSLYETLIRMNYAGYPLTLIYISPEEITGEKQPEVETILSTLPELGIKVYRINISDDLRSVLGYGGRKTVEKY